MGNPGIRHLFVDDEPSIREATYYELRRLGIDVTVAANGDEALALFRKNPFPTVTCDMKMPGMSGLQLLKEIKLIDPDAEVLVATGYGSQEDAIECLRAGAYDYIYKPFNLRELAVLVERASERRTIRAHLALYDFARPLSQSLDLDEVLASVRQGLAKALRADEITISMAPESEADRPAPSDEPLAAMEVQVLSSTENRISLTTGLYGRSGYLGMLRAFRVGHAPVFSESDKRSFLLFALQAANAVENARLHTALQRKMAELEQTREQLIQSEKMSAVGRLAAGVAHEINNPLTGILGQSQLLLMRLASDDPNREDLVFIEGAAQRCRKVVQNLLQFSRHQKLDREMADLWEIVHQSMAFMKKSFAMHHIQVEEQCEESLPPVYVSPMHITQVLLNLFQNAFDAMGIAGTLVIKGYRQEETVRISIMDTGLGIAPEALPHIFEPFYTTKEIGKGTGLGLSVSAGIMREHEGSIQVESPVDGQSGGTRFTLVFPFVRRAKGDMVSPVSDMARGNR